MRLLHMNMVCTTAACVRGCFNASIIALDKGAAVALSTVTAALAVQGGPPPEAITAPGPFSVAVVGTHVGTCLSKGSAALHHIRMSWFVRGGRMEAHSMGSTMMQNPHPHPSLACPAEEAPLNTLECFFTRK